MAVTAAFRDYILEQLNRLVPTTVRSMFGGAGLYSGGRIFGLLDNDTLYFKVDDGNRTDFEAAGCRPFRPFGPGTKPMGYFEVPADAIEDPDALRPWLTGALAAARAAKARGGAKPTVAATRGGRTMARARAGTPAEVENPRPASPSKRKAAAASGAAGRSGVSGDAAVENATGRAWAAWFKLLDSEGCRTMSHREIVAVVRAKYDVGPWWGQMVTVGYERARGLRALHQKADGFSASASRTLAVPLSELYRAWAEAPRRRSWLPPLSVTVKAATPNRLLRLELKGVAGLVRVEFHARGAAKSLVQIEHDRLADDREVKSTKALWGDALGRLKARLAARR